VRALILDFDGVIRDTKRANYEATLEVMEAHGLAPKISEKSCWRFRAHIAFTNRNDYMAAVYAIAMAGEKLCNAKRVGALIQRFPLSPEEKIRLGDAYSDSLFARIDGIPPCEGAREGLEALAAKMPLALVSDARRRGVEGWLKKEGMAPFFNAVLAFEDVPLPKPHPDGILKACRMLSVDAEDVAYVGDSENDIRTAKNAGCAAWCVLTGMGDERFLRNAGADRIFANLMVLADEIQPAAFHR